MSNVDVAEKLPARWQGFVPDNNDIPRYRRIQAELRRRISDGTLKPGQALPSRNALTAEFSTTRVTLDKAIQQLVDEGVLTSSKGSGTYVAFNDSSTPWAPRKKALRIGVVLGLQTPPPNFPPRENDIDHIFFGPVFRGISDALAGKPVEISYVNLPVAECLGLYRSSKLDALLLVTPSISDLPAMLKLQDEGVPFVAISISSSAPEHLRLPCVDADNRSGGYSAARHLIDLGHTRIGCVNLSTGHANHRDRMYGFRDALVEAGLPHGDDLFITFDRYAIEFFDPTLDHWLESGVELPTAVFACDFFMTLKTLSALRRHGIEVPSGMSLVGFDDPLTAEHLTPPLTTVRQPTYAIGQRAAKRLLDALSDPLGPQPLIGCETLPTELIVRQSAVRMAATAPSI